MQPKPGEGLGSGAKVPLIEKLGLELQKVQSEWSRNGRPTKPPLIRPNVSGLAHLPPVQLEFPCFVNWTLAWVGNRWAKLPLQADGRPASATNPQHMQTLAGALKNTFDSEHRCDGIGVGLLEELGVVGIDLDNCRNPTTGELTPTAQDILGRLPGAYAEVSVSGTGIHILVVGSYAGQRTRPAKKPADGTGIELYPAGRYFTLTGRLVQLPNRPRMRPGHDFSAELQAIYDQYFQAGIEEVRSPSAQPPTRPPRLNQQPRGQESVIDRLLKSKSSFHQETAGYFLYGSGNMNHSQADFRLVLALLHLTDDDPNLTDAIFRMSALYRPEKWNSSRGDSTYGWVTINNALMRRRNGSS